jgi:hypothetical protein
MLLDKLGILRGDGGSPVINGVTEDGYNSTTREPDTGQAVIAVYKTGKNGLPIVAAYKTGKGGSGQDNTYTLTIEACDAEAFDDGKEEVVATFPTVATPATADAEKGLFVRRVHTQKKYLRTVITGAGGGEGGAPRPNYGSIDYLVFITEGQMDIG